MYYAGTFNIRVSNVMELSEATLLLMSEEELTDSKTDTGRGYFS
jgi:hypothetical protein